LSDPDRTQPGEPDQTLPTDPDRTQTGDRHATIPAAEPGLPDRIGGYRPLRVLGRGGMGVVYEAEQQTPRRRVALKVIRPELATPDLRRRFAHESLFLGRLQHPGIAQVYEAGTAATDHGEVPFIAMELVEGRPLNVWLAEERPDRRTRLELMMRLCDAVHHAHQRGLIHRDLKPANVLVDGRGRPRVLDFGVARPADTDLEASLVTSHGELVGTVAYMSPEQLAGDPNDLDVRSDVYALGVILYEVLAGRSPLALTGRPLEDALRAIREDDPPLLAHHDPDLAGDLTVIAAKAVAKHRDDRYASANGLARDIQRHLDDQPIAAQPPSTLYLVRKFARRHRPLVIGAVGIVAALVLGVVVSTWQAVRATQAERLAGARLAQSESVTDCLQDMLASVQPSEARGREVTVAEVLDRAARDLDGGALAAQPAVESALRATVGNTYATLGRLEEAQHHLRLGFALADSLGPADGPERLAAVLDLAIVLRDAGDQDASEQLLAAEADRFPGDGPLAARYLGFLGDLRYARGHWMEADSLLARAQAIAEVHTDADSLALARVLVNRAFVLEQQDRRSRAEALVTRAEAIYRAAFGEIHPRIVTILIHRGDVERMQGRPLDALATHREALRIARVVYPDGHPNEANLLWRNSQSHYALGQWAEAEVAAEQSLEMRRRVFGETHRDVALSLQSLGLAQMKQGRFDEAERNARAALAMRRELFGDVHPSIVSSIQDLGHLARAQQRYARAESLFVQADTLIARLPEEVGRQQYDNAFSLAMIRQAQGRHADAEVDFRRALDIARRQHGDVHLTVAQALGNLATNLFRQGRKSEAADVQAEALQLNRDLGLKGGTLLMNIGNAAYLLDDAGRYDEADGLHREYIDLAGELYGDANRNQSSARGRYVENLLARGLGEAAEVQARQLVAWRRANLEPDDPERATSLAYVALALIEQGALADARELVDQADAELAALGSPADAPGLARLERAQAALAAPR
jgi:tetratricopeptide (TPR) repeat protein